MVGSLDLLKLLSRVVVARIRRHAWLKKKLRPGIPEKVSPHSRKSVTTFQKKRHHIPEFL
jgi:hypothetical protein